jgi:hypothetical protein
MHWNLQRSSIRIGNIRQTVRPIIMPLAQMMDGRMNEKTSTEWVCSGRPFVRLGSPSPKE